MKKYIMIHSGSLSILDPKEEKENTKLFHIKIQVKKKKVDVVFYDSHANLIAKDLINNLRLEVHDHPHSYSLGWVNKDADLKVTK
jgi:hypothetical protein